MVTNEMMDAIAMMIERCSNKEQAKGMKSVRKMLADFDEDGWLSIERPSNRHEWLEQYLSCRRNMDGENQTECHC